MSRGVNREWAENWPRIAGNGRGIPWAWGRVGTAILGRLWGKTDGIFRDSGGTKAMRGENKGGASLPGLGALGRPILRVSFRAAATKAEGGWGAVPLRSKPGSLSMRGVCLAA